MSVSPRWPRRAVVAALAAIALGGGLIAAAGLTAARADASPDFQVSVSLDAPGLDSGALALDHPVAVVYTISNISRDPMAITAADSYAGALACDTRDVDPGGSARCETAERAVTPLDSEGIPIGLRLSADVGARSWRWDDPFVSVPVCAPDAGASSGIGVTPCAAAAEGERTEAETLASPSDLALTQVAGPRTEPADTAVTIGAGAASGGSLSGIALLLRPRRRRD